MENKPSYLISTPENVDLHLELAGIANRVVAAIIDTALTYLGLLLLALIFIVLFYAVAGLAIPKVFKVGALVYLIGSGFFLAFLLFFGYFIYFEGTWQGQTPGKKFVGIRVIESDGQPVTWPAVAIRNLIRVVDTGLAFIGLLSIFIDKSERRLGDFAAGTIVIRERKAPKSEITVSAWAGQNTLSFVDLGRLSPEEYEILVSFLCRRRAFLPQDRQALAKRLAEHFLARLELPPLSEAPELFLERLFIAYRLRA